LAQHVITSPQSYKLRHFVKITWKSIEILRNCLLLQTGSYGSIVQQFSWRK
jgi:hypothetical protein